MMNELECNRRYEETWELFNAYISKATGLKVSVECFLQLIDFMHERKIEFRLSDEFFVGIDKETYPAENLLDIISDSIADLRKHLNEQS